MLGVVIIAGTGAVLLGILLIVGYSDLPEKIRNIFNGDGNNDTETEDGLPWGAIKVSKDDEIYKNFMNARDSAEYKLSYYDDKYGIPDFMNNDQEANGPLNEFNFRRKDGTSFSPREVINARQNNKAITGIYIILNKTKNMYYVGQAQNVYQRCSNHFLGKGNADIYVDYKYGDEFIIRFIALVDSGYTNLDELERYYIDEFDAVEFGYNKKKGNK